MKIQINGKQIELKNTFRSLIIYEKITNDVFTPSNITNILIYFYSVIMACDKDCTLSFDGFTDWLDDNPNELNNFTNWLGEINKKNGYINGNTDEKTDVEPKKG